MSLKTFEPLTTLPVIFVGGPYDGETRDLETRSVVEFTFGFHSDPDFAFYERYVRTIELSPLTGRIVFRYAGQDSTESHVPNALRRLLLTCGSRKPRIIKAIG